MKIRITSFRGDHQGVVETESGKALFEKLTGQSDAPLPDLMKLAIPETFQELESLWTPGNPGYSAISLDKDGNIIALKDFQQTAETVVFIALIIGG